MFGRSLSLSLNLLWERDRSRRRRWRRSKNFFFSGWRRRRSLGLIHQFHSGRKRRIGVWLPAKLRGEKEGLPLFLFLSFPTPLLLLLLSFSYFPRSLRTDFRAFGLGKQKRFFSFLCTPSSSSSLSSSQKSCCSANCTLHCN